MTRQEFKAEEARLADIAIRHEDDDATEERPFPMTRRGTLELHRPPMPYGTPFWVLATEVGGELLAEPTIVRVK